jgi:hypothetical protein
MMLLPSGNHVKPNRAVSSFRILLGSDPSGFAMQMEVVTGLDSESWRKGSLVPSGDQIAP